MIVGCFFCPNLVWTPILYTVSHFFWNTLHEVFSENSLSANFFCKKAPWLAFGRVLSMAVHYIIDTQISITFRQINQNNWKTKCRHFISGEFKWFCRFPVRLKFFIFLLGTARNITNTEAIRSKIFKIFKIFYLLVQTMYRGCVKN